MTASRDAETAPPPEPVSWRPVRELLALRSGEADLLCAAGHVAGHPDVCPGGCALEPGRSRVADVLAYKALRRVDLTWPVQVEGEWLIDGHHRLLAAVAGGVEVLPVVAVTGVRAQQELYHRQVAERARRRGPTMTHPDDPAA